jgi:hypothetical protein
MLTDVIVNSSNSLIALTLTLHAPAGPNYQNAFGEVAFL